MLRALRWTLLGAALVGCGSGQLQANTQTARDDQDNDGVVDTDDACPKEAGTESIDPEQHGCPSKGGPTHDVDRDGIADSEDSCPDQAGERSDVQAQHGCPANNQIAPEGGEGTPDTDRDGVPDWADACPKEAGEGSGNAAQNGCPAAGAAPGGGKAARAKQLVPWPPYAGPPLLRYVGFLQLPDGTTRIQLDLTSEAPVTMLATPGVVTYTLEGAEVPVTNNRRPLPTGVFETPAARVIVDATGGARWTAKGRAPKKTDKPARVSIALALSADIQPSHRMVKRADGGTSLEIDLPKAARKAPDAPKGAPAPAPPPTTSP